MPFSDQVGAVVTSDRLIFSAGWPDLRPRILRVEPGTPPFSGPGSDYTSRAVMVSYNAGKWWLTRLYSCPKGNGGIIRALDIRLPMACAVRVEWVAHPMVGVTDGANTEFTNGARIDGIPTHLYWSFETQHRSGGSPWCIATRMDEAGAVTASRLWSSDLGQSWCVTTQRQELTYQAGWSGMIQNGIAWLQEVTITVADDDDEEGVIFAGEGTPPEYISHNGASSLCCEIWAWA